MNLIVFIAASITSLLLSWLAAQIPATLVTGAFVNVWPVWTDAIPGMVLGWVVSMGLLRKGRNRKADALPIVIAPMLAGGAVGMIKAGLFLMNSDVTWSAFVFMLLGIALMVAAVAATVGLVQRVGERLVGYAIVFGAVTIGIFGCYLSGRDALSFQKDAGMPTATARLRQYRWLNSTLIRDTTVERVIGWEHEHDIDIPGMNVVLLTHQPADQLVIAGNSARGGTLAHSVTDSLPPFLESPRQSLDLVEETPLWPLSSIICICGAVMLTGVSWLPRADSTLAHFDRALKWSGIATFSIAAVLLLSTAVLQMNRNRAEGERARAELESHGAHVQRQDLVFRGETFVSNAWHVSIRDSDFGDDDLATIMPFLDKAPGLSLDLSNTRVTDDGIALLKDVSFRMLYARGTGITNDTLGHLRYNVSFLDVRDTAVNTQGLAQHPSIWIENLLISDRNLSLNSIAPIYSVQGLNYVRIDSSAVTAKEFDDWRSGKDGLPRKPVIEFDDAGLANRQPAK